MQSTHALSTNGHPAAINHWGLYLKLTTVAFLWGGTFIAGHQLGESLPPLVSAAARFFVAALLLSLWLWHQEGGFPALTRKQFIATLGLGATGIYLYNLCFFSALAEISASRTALLVSLNPIMTALVLGTLFREKLGLKRWAGISLAFVGAAIIVVRGELSAIWQDFSGTLGRGELFMLGAVLSWVTYTILGRYALKGLSPLAATTYAAFFGFLMLATTLVLNPSALSDAAFNLNNLLAIVYLGALGTVVAFVWYYQGVQTLGPARAAIFTNLVPVFGVLLAMLLLGETLLPSVMFGGLLVITGVAITNHTKVK